MNLKDINHAIYKKEEKNEKGKEKKERKDWRRKKWKKKSGEKKEMCEEERKKSVKDWLVFMAYQPL